MALSLLSWTTPQVAQPVRFDLYGSLQKKVEVRDQTESTPAAAIVRESWPANRVQAYRQARELHSQAMKKKGRQFDAPTARSLAFYLQAMGIAAGQINRPLDLQTRLPADWRAATTLDRLAIWQAAELARDRSLDALIIDLAAKNNWQANDPLNQAILTLYLQALHDQNPALGLSVMQQLDHVQDAMSDLWRARILSKQNAQNKRDQLRLLVRSSRATNAWWIEKAIISEARDHLGEYMRADAGIQWQELRDLVAFASQMNTGELKQFKGRLNAAMILATTNQHRIQDDGIFFIRSQQSWQVYRLAQKDYTLLSQEPQILHSWTGLLLTQKKYALITKTLRPFEHSLVRHSGLWEMYLTALEKTGNRSRYFAELLRYLQNYPAHFEVQDRLIAYLIGENPQKYQFAQDAVWRSAFQKLSHHTDSGRFVYWLREYFQSVKNQSGVKRIDQHIYALAPGSFYIGAWWDRNPWQGGDFVRDWQKLNTRRDYQIWLSRYGGLTSARQFVRRRSPARWLDPAAVQLERELNSDKYRVPDGVLLIFQLEHFQLGHASLKAWLPVEADEATRYAHLAWIGQHSNNLNYDVYYTRQFLRERSISEDPFGLPDRLLARLYPRPWYESVKRYARLFKTDSESVYAIMRQESLFKPDAVSRSGARGLMQIMPRTGQWLAGKMGLQQYDLNDPDTNIKMGSRFFADLTRSYDNDFRWAAIAYNGGPGNLRKWKASFFRGDLYHFLEHLPKAESRNYCRITYQNYLHYQIASDLYGH
ncbi:MAG: lytic transglycosylase domain-containing protein [Leptospiraceae bacterium]|nr:lytic transglycosylase domain-containing protein [Leptospiraceae bacterium]